MEAPTLKFDKQHSDKTILYAINIHFKTLPTTYFCFATNFVGNFLIKCGNYVRHPNSPTVL